MTQCLSKELTKEAQLIQGSIWLEEAGKQVLTHEDPSGAGGALPSPLRSTSTHPTHLLLT